MSGCRKIGAFLQGAEQSVSLSAIESHPGGIDRRPAQITLVVFQRAGGPVAAEQAQKKQSATRLPHRQRCL